MMIKIFGIIFTIAVCFLFIACPIDNKDIGSECIRIDDSNNQNISGLVPFTQTRQSDFGMGDIPLYEYHQGDRLYSERGRPITPHTMNSAFGDEQISIIMEWTEGHTGVLHWARDVEVIDNVLVINTLRLDPGGGFTAITHWKVTVFVDKAYAGNIIEYKVVTRNVFFSPTQLNVTIREEYMDRVADKDFAPEDFGPLVNEIRWSRQDFAAARRLIVYYRAENTNMAVTRELLEALPFVARARNGFDLEMVIYIDPAYNDRFDREEFTLSDFGGIEGIISILRYQHPHIRVNSRITLILQTPGTENLNRLIDYVMNHNPYVETTSLILNRYRNIYLYRQI